MARVYTAAEIRAAEAPQLAAGVPLMHRAAAGLAREILTLEPASALVLAGAGNNGADALLAAAKLARHGVDVVIIATTDHPNGEAMDAALNAGAQARPTSAAATLAHTTDVTIDGILGIGTSSDRALRGAAREVVRSILDLAAPPVVVAVDIPSGIDPDNGSVPDPTVLHATMTVTFGGLKAGLFLQPAAGLAGEIRLVEVGIEGSLALLPARLSPE